MACPKRYYYSYVLHRRGRGTLTPALSYGSAWHSAMECSYKSPVCSRDELINRVLDHTARLWQKSANPEDYRTFSRLMVEYERYLDTWGLPWEESGKTVGWPDRPLVELAVELPIPGARHPYTGKIDRIIEEHGQTLIEDHKTASMMRSDYFRQWELDHQMIGYDGLATILTGRPIAGVRINLHVVRKSDSVFERRTIMFSPKRVEQWMMVYDQWLERIEHDTEMLQSGHPDAFPENFSACSGKYGMCQYAGVCSLDPARRMYALEQDFDITPWNPLEAQEEAADA